MKKLLIIFSLMLFSSTQYGQIIADHTVVDKYNDIPRQWIDSVKTMWLDYAGRSHSMAIATGMTELEALDPTYNSYVQNAGTPMEPRSDMLRACRGTWGNYEYETGWQYWYGEDSWWTNSTGLARTKAGLSYANSIGNPITVFGFGHSYEFYASNPSATADPVTGNLWFGWSAGSPSGDGPWGLDDNDNSLTGNSVNMDDYLAATQEYIDYCADNSIPTTVIFTTGPVDRDGITATDEAMYSGFLKNEHIRNYVNSNGGYLFDYGDILSYNDAGEEQILTWNGNSFPIIHSDNLGGTSVAHIWTVGTIRLAKAMWWLLARIAGWDGTINGEDISPPTSPSNLAIGTITENTIELTWSAASDNVSVSNYNIYRDGILIGNSTTTSYTDNTLSPCTYYTYTITALDAAGNESNPSSDLEANTCTPDLAPTLIVTPNISHGVTAFDVIVRVTELNLSQTNGNITIRIPIDSRWGLDGTFNQTLTSLDGMPLDNGNWSYSSDAVYHIFSTSASIAPGETSTFGFTIFFDPGTSKGEYTITAQLANGAGGETRYTNNTDSERLDYFPQGN